MGPHLVIGGMFGVRLGVAAFTGEGFGTGGGVRIMGVNCNCQLLSLNRADDVNKRYRDSADL